jgi:hypothetical protein
MWRAGLLFVGACSFAFMSSPKPVMETDCNASYDAPVTDTVVAGAALVLSSAIAAVSVTEQGGATLAPLLIPLVPMTLLYGTSATYGYLSRQRCERVKSDRGRDVAATSR